MQESFAEVGGVYFTPAGGGCCDFFFFLRLSLNISTGRVKVWIRTLFRGLDKTSAQWRSTGCARLCTFGVKLPSGQDMESSLLACRSCGLFIRIL